MKRSSGRAAWVAVCAGGAAVVMALGGLVSGAGNADPASSLAGFLYSALSDPTDAPAPLAPAVPLPPVASARPVEPRADVVVRQGVPVRNVTVAKRGRLVSARVFWNQAMIARKGHRDRFDVRLVAFGAAGAESPIVLASRSTRKRPPTIQKVSIKLGKAKASELRGSSDVVLAVSQHYGRKGRHKNMFFRNNATLTQLKGGSTAQASGHAATSSRVGRDCQTVEIRPGADLSGCDLSRANLSVCDLTGGNLTGAILTGTILTKCGLAGAQMAGADLAGVVSGGVTGTPASLPDGWTIVNGTLTTTGSRPRSDTCAGGGPCAVGDTGPGGGTVFYVDTNRAARSQYWEAAPTRWKTGATGDPVAGWGCYGTAIRTGTGIGTGAANTAAVVARCGDAETAAELAAGYSGGGRSDWFLPSKDELNQLCKYAHGQSAAVADQATVCASSGSLLRGFASDNYWSSSQDGANYAWLQVLDMGLQFKFGKYFSSIRVRPVRAFR